MHNIVPYSPLPGGGRGFFQVIWEGFQVVEVGKEEKRKRKKKKGGKKEKKKGIKRNEWGKKGKKKWKVFKDGWRGSFSR